MRAHGGRPTDRFLLEMNLSEQEQKRWVWVGVSLVFNKDRASMKTRLLNKVGTH
jgi:hypothetical protein